MTDDDIDVIDDLRARALSYHTLPEEEPQLDDVWSDFFKDDD